MKIKKIQIQNFRCFKDYNELTFNTDGKITLIYGLAGSGKTSLLQFINWVFYDEIDFHVSKDKNIYNSHTFNNTQTNDTFKVEGKIDFIHDDVDYQIVRSILYRKSYPEATIVENEEVLTFKGMNGSWKIYDKNVNQKINEIIPKALAKYFFFHGEKSLGLEKGNTDLKKAIHSMFSLDVYQNLTRHLGDKVSSQSLINRYVRIKNLEKPKDIQLSVNEYQEYARKAEATIISNTNALKKLDTELREYNERKKELIEIIGNSKMSTFFEDSYQKNQRLIKENEIGIKREKIEIGNLMYLHYPYILLSSQIQFLKGKLSDSATSEKSFAGIRKDLLLDILHQEECICGNHIGRKEHDEIQKLINSLPPKSFKLVYNEFEQDLKRKFQLSSDIDLKINQKLKLIDDKKNEIFRFENENKKLLLDIKRFQSVKKYAEELSNIERLIETKLKEKGKIEQNISVNENIKRNSLKKVNEIMQSKGRMDIIEKKIDVLEHIKSIVEARINKKTADTVKNLEESIVSVYQLLSTRNDLVAGKKFLNDDFTLRNEYKTGGQEVIDIYAYVIGMIKAIEKASIEDDADEKEFPIVVDAPFSKTDHIQLSHVIKVLPEVAPQVALFTFDIIRIKEDKENLKNIGSLWILEYNSDQTISTIRRGNLNAI